MTEEYTWLLIAYTVGTIFGLWVGFKIEANRIVEMTIDSLIAQGFLKTREDEKGEVEIIPFNDQENI